MGTAGVLGFIILGQRYATYNHWDSYPEGLGKDIVEFILSLTPEDYTTMAQLVTELTWVDSESTPSPELQEHYQKLGFTDLSVSSRSPKEWYCLLRKTQGAAALPAIQSGDLKHVVKSSFEDNDWDWGYFIDFERHILETWQIRDTWSWNKIIRMDEVSFENLIKGGVETYLEFINQGPGEGDNGEEEEEREAWGGW